MTGNFLFVRRADKVAYNELFTGYFANTKKYIEAGYTPVSVAGRTPAFFEGEHWVDFAPRKEMFLKWKRGGSSNADYAREYLAYLDTLPNEDIEELRRLTKEAKYVMCCYEKVGDFCHRNYLALFLREKYGFKVRELILEEIIT